MSSKADELIIKLSNEGKTMRDITKEVYYWDKAHHKKFVSLGYVHKIIDVHKSSIQNKQGESLAKEELNN